MNRPSVKCLLPPQVLHSQTSTASSFDFVGEALASLDLDRQSRSWEISDHCPLWVELLVQ